VRREEWKQLTYKIPLKPKDTRFSVNVWLFESHLKQAVCDKRANLHVDITINEATLMILQQILPCYRSEALLVALLLSAIGAAPAYSHSVDGEQTGLGSCIDQNRRPLQLRKIMFLETRDFIQEMPQSTMRVTLNRQTITIKITPRKGEESWRPIDVGGLVSRGDVDADVDLKLGLYENNLVLYWRETYKHRMYRQGLFRIKGQELIVMCEGYGGEDISH